MVPGIVLSIAMIVALQLAVDRWPELRTVYRIAPLVLVVALLGLFYGNWIARDRKAFLSVAVPAVGLAAASILVRWPWSAALLWGAIGLVVGIVWSSRFQGWWTVHVLRRPPLTPRRRFRGQLRSDLLDWSEALAGAGPLTPGQRSRARDAITYMTKRNAPDAQMAAIRDDYVDLAERWTATPREEAHAQDYAELRGELSRLHTRLNATIDDE